MIPSIFYPCYKILVGFLIVAACCFLHCQQPVAGGTSTTDNPKVIGTIVDDEQQHAANTRVMLLPENYNPLRDSGVTVDDTTDEFGRYELPAAHVGFYTIQAVSSDSKTRLLIKGIQVETDDDSVNVPDGVLKPSGAVRINLPDAIDRVNGYCYIPGTTVFTLLSDTGSEVVLDSVPATIVPAVYFAMKSDTAHTVLRYDVHIASGDTALVAMPYWKYATQLILNTTSSGADVAGTVVDFPLLVRLREDNFDFSRTNEDGRDIRFTKPDGSPLPYEIERWDPVNDRAEVWVNVDTVYGNNDMQSIIMYCGNPEAGSESNGRAVFDTSAGFQAVWHLSGVDQGTAPDATANGYHGTPFNMDVASDVSGAIGNAPYFDGKESYISIPNSASGSLDMEQNSEYSISCWAYADTIDTLWYAIAGKGHEQYYLKLKCHNNGKATWEFVEFQEQEGWEYTEDSVPPAPGAKQWVYVTGVRSGTEQYLYINGDMVNDSALLMAGQYPKNSDDDFTIGRHARLVTIPYYEGWCNFKGKIDEVRVMDFAPDSNWIRLCYMNQKAEDALVEFR